MKQGGKRIAQAGIFGLLWVSLLTNLYFLVFQPRSVFSFRRLTLAAVAAFVLVLLLWLLNQRGVTRITWRTISPPIWWIGIILSFVLFLIAPAPTLHSLTAPVNVRISLEPLDRGEASLYLIWLNNGLGDLSFKEIDIPPTAQITPQGILIKIEPNQTAEISWRGRIWGELRLTMRSEAPVGLNAQVGSRSLQVAVESGIEKTISMLHLSSAYYFALYLLVIIIGSFSWAWLGQICLEGSGWVNRRYPALRGHIVQFLPLGSLAMVGLFYALTLREGHPWRDDFAQYIAHARNLAQGEPYTAIGILHNPAVVLGPTAYPPLFPLLLAPLYAVFGLNLTIFKVVGVACGLASLWFFERWLRPRFQPVLRGVAILLAGLHPWFWDYKDQILSDMPFMLLGLLSLVWWRDWREEKSGVKGWMVGLAIAAAIAARSAGLVLLAAVLADGVLRRCWRRRDFLLVAAIPLVAVGLLNILFPTTGDYLGQARGWNWAILERNWDTIKTFFLEIWRSNQLPIGSISLITILGLSLVGVGFVLNAGRIAAVEFYLLGTLAMIAIWPHPQGFRFFLPIFPFLIGYVLGGWQWLSDKIQPFLHSKIKGWGIGLAWLILVVLAAGMMEGYWKDYRRQPLHAFQEGIGLPVSQQAFDFIRQETQSTQVIAFFKPRALALFTGRTAFAPYWNSQQPQRLLDDLAAFQADYLVVWKPDYGDLTAFARQHSLVFALIYENEEFEVYSVAGLEP